MSLFDLLGAGLQDKILKKVGQMMKDKGAKFALISIDEKGDFDAKFITDELIVLKKSDYEKLKEKFISLQSKISENE